LIDQIEKNEMVGACSMYEGEERYTEFWWGNLRARDHLEKHRPRWDDNIK